MTSFTDDVATAQAALLANDYTLGKALLSLAKYGNRADLFAALRDPEDDASLGRIFRQLIVSELRHEAVQLVAETLDDTYPTTANFADCPRPLAINTGD